MIYILLIFLLTLIIIDLVKNKKIHTPGVVFNGMFFFILFIYNFYLSDIQQILTTKTLVILFLSIASFNLALVSYNIIIPEEKNNEKILCKKINNKKINEQKEFIFYGIHSIIIIIFLVEVIVCKGCPFVWRIIGNTGTYMTFGIPYLHMILYVLIVIMGVYTMFQKGDYTKFTYLLISILIISRGLMLEIIGGGIFYKIVMSNKVKKQTIFKIILIGLIALILFACIGNFRTGESEFLSVSHYKDCYDWIPTGFKWLYAYLCFSFSNLNNLFSLSNGCIGYGKFILNACLPFIVKWRLNFQVPEAPNQIIDPHFNVSTGFVETYMDFGVIGLVIFFFALGIYLEKLRRLSSKNNIFGILYSLSMMNVVFFCHNNRFFTINFIIEVLILINLIPHSQNKKIYLERRK